MPYERDGAARGGGLEQFVERQVKQREGQIDLDGPTDHADDHDAEAEGTPADGDDDIETEDVDGVAVVRLSDDAVLWIDENGDPVTKAQARDNQMRQAAFTQKTQELAAERRVAQGVARQLYGELQGLQSLYASLPPSTQAELAQYVAQLEQDYMAWRLPIENELMLERIPEWKADPKLATRERKEIREYLTADGFGTEDEIDSVLDSRIFVLARGAMLWDRIQKNGKEALVEKTKGRKVLKPGARDTRPAETVSRRRLEELRGQIDSIEGFAMYHAAKEEYNKRHAPARR